MEQSREEILTLIHSLEQKYELVDWQVRGMHIWPFMRIAIFNELTQKKVTDTRNKQISSGRFLVFYNGLKESLFVKRYARQAISLVFASQAHRQVIDGIHYNRFADPLMDDIVDNSSGIQLLFETSKLNEYTKCNYKEKRLVKLSQILDLLHYYTQIKQKIKPSRIDVYPELQQLKELSKSVMMKLSKKLNKQLRNILVYQQFSRWLLKNYQGDRIFFVCYYGLFNMCLINEARKQGIKTIDIQHGVINDKHIAYAFKKTPSGGYNCLPNEFWTWTSYEADSINEWANACNQHRAFSKGNLWIEAVQHRKIDFGHLSALVEKESKPIILYTLSNRDDIFPEFLIEAIKQLHGKYSFWFRLHPRQLAFREVIEEQLKTLGIFKMIELSRASELPLPLILSYTKLHITQFSTVVLEAAYFNVPSILFHPLGKTYFENNPLKSYFHFYDFKEANLSKEIKEIM